MDERGPRGEEVPVTDRWPLDDAAPGPPASWIALPVGRAETGPSIAELVAARLGRDVPLGPVTLVAVSIRSGRGRARLDRERSDLVATVARQCAARGWRFDSPPPVSAWLKVPGCLDLFRDHTVTELAVDAPWPFAELRAAVPPGRDRSRSPFHRSVFASAIKEYTGAPRP